MTVIASPVPQITTPPQALAEVLVNENFAALYAALVYAYAYQTSSGLTWGYYGGRWGGFSVAAGTLTLSASATNYIVVLKSTGAISVSTTATNWNDATLYSRVYKVVTGASTVTSAEDHRAGPGGVLGGGGSSSSGTSASGLEYTASSTTTDSDPGTGTIRWNNATHASATILYVDNAEADGASVAALWPLLAVGSLVKITKADDVDTWQLWKVNSTPVNGTGYYKLPVTLIAQEGATIANAVSVLIDIDSSAVPTSFTGGTMTSAINEAPTVTIASSSTPAIGAAAANTILITGTTTITGFDTIAAGTMRRVRFSGALTLTYNATSLILPTSANITTAADDVAEFLSLGSGNWFCTSYSRKSGQALSAASGGTVDINLQTGTTYTYLSTDDGDIVEHSNASAIAATLPQATGSFADGWSVYVKCTNAGAVTITPTTSSIDGGLTLVLQRGDAALIVSKGGNYKAYVTRAATRGVFALTDASSITTDAANYDVFRVVLGGSRTLANPTNMSNGQKMTWVILQDGTGGRTLAYDTKFAFEGGVAPGISVLANAKNLLEGVYNATDDLIYSSLKINYGANLVYTWSLTWLRLTFDGSDAATTTTDVSPSPLTVTLTNGASLRTAAAKFGTAALRLDGTNDYATAGTAALAKFLHDGTSVWTIGAWVKFNNFSVDQTIFDTVGGSSANAGIYLAITAATRAPNFFMGRAVAASFIVSTGITAPTGTWPNDASYHWLEVSYDPSLTANALVIKVDGTTIASLTRQTSNAHSSSNPANALNIGAYGGGAGNFLNGDIDDLWITKQIVLNGIPTVARPVS